MRKLNKKGQILNNISGIAIGVGVLALVIVIIFLINANVKEQTVSEITATSYADASKTLTNITNTTFEECIPDETMVVTEILNGSGADCVALGAGNYSVTLNTVMVTYNGAALGGYEAATNVTYSCRNPSLAYNATGSLNNDTYSLVGWVSLVVVVLIGILILGLVRQIRQ